MNKQCWQCHWTPTNNDSKPFRLNIITPTTRLVNLKRIGESIKFDIPGINIMWDVHIDSSIKDFEIQSLINSGYNGSYFISKVSGIAGHVHRNSLLMLIDWRSRYEGPSVLDEWIMSLDDDNIMHPDLIPWLAANIGVLNNYSGIIFDQAFKNGVTRLKADPDKITVGNIDTAQYMFRGSIVKGLRFDESRYDADGVFIEELYARNKDKFLIVNQPLCYYNYLR